MITQRISTIMDILHSWYLFYSIYIQTARNSVRSRPPQQMPFSRANPSEISSPAQQRDSESCSSSTLAPASSLSPRPVNSCPPSRQPHPAPSNPSRPEHWRIPNQPHISLTLLQPHRPRHIILAETYLNISGTMKNRTWLPRM